MTQPHPATSELLACPFCGSPGKRTEGFHVRDVHCPTCFAVGPQGNDQDGVDRWNTRTGSVDEAAIEQVREVLQTAKRYFETRCAAPTIFSEIESALAALNRRTPPAAGQSGWVMVPKEPTEAMWTAGREPLLFRDAPFPEMMMARQWFHADKDAAPREPDGHAPKGSWAVWVYRAMLAAAPPPPAAAEGKGE